MKLRSYCHGSPGPYPADALGVDSRLEQSHAGVHPRLSRADHREAVGRFGEVNEVAGRDERDARFDREPRHVTRRDLGLDVGRVDELAPRLYNDLGAVEQRSDEVAVSVIAWYSLMPTNRTLPVGSRCSSSTRK